MFQYLLEVRNEASNEVNKVKMKASARDLFETIIIYP